VKPTPEQRQRNPAMRKIFGVVEAQDLSMMAANLTKLFGQLPERPLSFG
jgi:hypothetical protein